MVKKRLMLGAAFAALSLVPLTAAATEENGVGNNGGGRGGVDLEIDADWDNTVEVELNWEVDVEKHLDIRGHISIDGNVTADALSQATLDDKQILQGNVVDFEDYQNANTSGTVGSEPGVGTGEDSADYEEEGAPKFATYENTVTASSLLESANGNIGLNMAAGDYNLQENAAVLSQTDGSFPAETQTSTSAFSLAGAGAFAKNFDASGAIDFVHTESNGTVTSTESWQADGSITLALSGSDSFTLTGTSSEASGRTARTSGAAEAGMFSLQSLYNNEFNSGIFDKGDGETDEQNPEIENSIVTNTVTLGDGTLDAADGNIGANLAAGAFNLQKNALVIASVTGGHLAEATAGVMQVGVNNRSVVEDVTNDVTLSGSLSNASGNIGVNMAAGVGNVQLNSLTIASTIATSTGGTTGGGGGGGTDETPPT
jgi:hypothetical protein